VHVHRRLERSRLLDAAQPAAQPAATAPSATVPSCTAIPEPITASSSQSDAACSARTTARAFTPAAAEPVAEAPAAVAAESSAVATHAAPATSLSAIAAHTSFSVPAAAAGAHLVRRGQQLDARRVHIQLGSVKQQDRNDFGRGQACQRAVCPRRG